MKELFQRFALFLGSTIEYGWPDHRGVFTSVVWGPMIGILTLGLSNSANNAADSQRREFMQRCSEYGDFDFWPFRTKDEFEAQKHLN